ncbi:MAG: division/cell wall cluster transcriptional repressor MraZ [Clostridiales bacterium]|nr:division/cell wall cluster transcriptional repressor MraZ [Clostridiales bacterium]
MVGEYQHTLDAKGRMNFPAKLREELGESFVITKTIGSRCLRVYTMESWDNLVQAIKSKPSSKTAQIERFLFGGACTAEPDKQGRILIPSNLRGYANLTSEVVVVGLSDRAEIWDKAAWNELNSTFDDDELEELAMELEL